MFSRIFYSILFIGIVNEMCHAKQLLGCAKFSDHPQGLPAGPQEVVVILSSDPTLNVNFLPVGVPTPFMPAYLVLESCEVGTKTRNIINKTTLQEKADKYKKQAKQIRIDFGSLENNCMLIAEIKSQIEKLLFPEETKPTVYIDLTKKTSTLRKAIKISEKGDFLLVDDCKTDVGDFADLTKVKDIVHKMAKGVQRAVKIEFNTESCQPIVSIAVKVYESLMEIHKDKEAKLRSVKKPTGVPKTIKEGTHIRCKDGKFALVDDCTKLMSIKLDTPTKLEDVLHKIANPEIERVEAALNKPWLYTLMLRDKSRNV